MRMVLASAVTPVLPISILLSPVVRLLPALTPNAILLLPVVLKSAPLPLAVLKLPVVLWKSAPAPVAVFASAVLTRSVPAPRPVQKLPSVRLRTENIPTAVLYRPVVRLKSALCPSAVLPPGYPPSGGGLTACAFGSVAARQRSASVAKSNGVLVFIAWSFAKIPPTCREQKLARHRSIWDYSPTKHAKK